MYLLHHDHVSVNLAEGFSTLDEIYLHIQDIPAALWHIYGMLDGFRHTSARMYSGLIDNVYILPWYEPCAVYT